LTIFEVNFQQGTKEFMTDINNQKEDVKMHLKDLRSDLKRMHLAVIEEMLLPDPEDVKALMSKMDILLNAIENN
tara:strand:+ start:319 stop:540 length:222 start_codon:yes stop_codon:yes gene_type:complete